MKLRINRSNGYICGYTIAISTNDARVCGFVNDDGTSKPIRKTVEADKGRIIIELDNTYKKQQAE